MKRCFTPGEGFPARLQALLLDLGKRPADVQCDSDGKVKADTVSGWLNTRHLPERAAFLHFCRTYQLTSANAHRLLYASPKKRDERLTQRPTPGNRLLEGLFEALEAVECRIDHRTGDEIDEVSSRLRATSRRLTAR